LVKTTVAGIYSTTQIWLNLSNFGAEHDIQTN
jgi:hypothetical protein